MKTGFNVKMLLVATAALVMVGCEDMGGQLVVSKEMKVHAGFHNDQVIAPGTYKTSLNFKKNSVVASIEVASNTKTKVTFDLPANSSLPANGNFELKSAQTGQPIDVLGTVKTTVSESERRSGWESCQYQSYEPVCGQNGCVTQPTTRWGQQYTEYYLRNTDKNMSFYLTEVGSVSKKLAQFKGASTVSEKIILRQDRCF